MHTPQQALLQQRQHHARLLLAPKFATANMLFFSCGAIIFVHVIDSHVFACLTVFFFSCWKDIFYS